MEQQQYQYAEQQQMLEENFDQEQALMQQNYLKLFEGGAAAQQAGSCLDSNIPTLVGPLNVRVCPDDSTGCGLVRVVLGTLVNTRVETCKQGSVDIMCMLYVSEIIIIHRMY